MIKSNKKVKAVVFDWAGTTVDFGCRAPLAVIMNIFSRKGLPITVEEASKHMGILKNEHFREIFKLERIKNEYLKKYKKLPDENTISEFYSDFEPELFKILKNYSEPNPYVIETVNILRRKYNLKIGSTTGYTKEMMNFVCPIAESKGYKPDYMISSTEVKQGRPYPYMLYQNAINLGVFPMESIVKVGDTLSDIAEARNAGTWAVGLVEGSSLLGYNLEEFNAVDKEVLAKKKENVIKSFKENNADLIANSFKDLPEIIDKINEKLNQNEFPGSKVQVPRQPYLLFTPGPITTSTKVKLPMMSDWGSREDDYLNVVQNVRNELVNLALLHSDLSSYAKDFTSVIMQGSGTFGVESCVGSVIPEDGKLLVVINGQYGHRMKQIAKILGINTVELEFEETEVPDAKKLDDFINNNKDITHVGIIHSETTTGILNPLEDIGKVVKKHNKLLIVDAMSSFGAIPLDMKELGVDFLISSSNKNIQGVPGFSFVITRKKLIEKCEEIPPRSLSLNLYDQWNYLEKNKGGFRFTSPVHTIRAFNEALEELKEEGGVYARFKRYSEMQKLLSDGMKEMNFKPINLGKYQGPIITTFLTPKSKNYNFDKFYKSLKEKDCILYPGKLTKVDSFRIGTIGNINSNDIQYLLQKVRESIFWDNTLI